MRTRRCAGGVGSARAFGQATGPAASVRGGALDDADERGAAPAWGSRAPATRPPGHAGWGRWALGARTGGAFDAAQIAQEPPESAASEIDAASAGFA